MFSYLDASMCSLCSPFIPCIALTALSTITHCLTRFNCVCLCLTLCVTITPYLSRDTTYCYRHCKGISRFPLLPYHPSLRPMPDRIASASLTFDHITLPHRTHASDPITCTASWTASFLAISIPFPLDVIMTYDSDLDSDLIFSMTSSLTDPLR